MLLGVQHSELVQRLSDTARPRELQQEEAKATDRSVHFVTLELCCSKKMYLSLEIDLPSLRI